MISDIVAVLVAYALGCVQTGYYLVRLWTGQDLRRCGSGSTGARNAGRMFGRKGFALVLLGDAGKGALAIATTIWLYASPTAAAAALAAVTIGHVWPVQLRFSGGRGVAVGLGSLAVFDPRLLAVLAAATLLCSTVSRRFQISGLFGFAILPAAACLFRLATEALVGVSCLSGIVLFAHRSHIIRWLGPEKGGQPPAEQ